MSSHRRFLGNFDDGDGADNSSLTTDKSISNLFVVGGVSFTLIIFLNFPPLLLGDMTILDIFYSSI